MAATTITTITTRAREATTATTTANTIKASAKRQPINAKPHYIALRHKHLKSCPRNGRTHADLTLPQGPVRAPAACPPALWHMARGRLTTFLLLMRRHNETIRLRKLG